MLDVHWSELILVALAALLILGPKDFIKFMHMAGRWMREVKLTFYKMNAALDAASYEVEELDKKQQELPAKEEVVAEDLKQNEPKND